MEELQDGLKRAVKRIDACLNLIGGRLGLDHDQVLFGRFAIPVMVRYLDKRAGPPDVKEQDKLLFLVRSGRHVGAFLRLHRDIYRPGSGRAGRQ